MKHQRRTFKEDRHFHNSFTDYSKDFTDYYIVNKPEDGEVAYSLGIWTGSGYYVARFLCFADEEYEAIDRTFDYCNEKYKDQFVFNRSEVEEAASRYLDMYDEYEKLEDMEKELEELKNKYSDHVNNLDNWTEYRQAERRMDELEYEIEPLREELIDRYVDENYVSNEEYTLYAYAENFRIDETPKEIADEILSQNAENLEESRKRNRRMMKESRSNPKFITVKVLQGNYGYGWDDLLEADPNDEKEMKEFRDNIKDYKQNEPQYAHRVITRRIKNPNYVEDEVKNSEVEKVEETETVEESKRKLPNKRLIERNEKKDQKMKELDSLVCESSNGIFKNEEIKKYADVIMKKFSDIDDFEDFYNNVKDWMSSFGDISEKALADEYFYEVDELENDDETYRQAIDTFIEDVYDRIQEKKELRESRIRNRNVMKEASNDKVIIITDEIKEKYPVLRNVNMIEKWIPDPKRNYGGGEYGTWEKVMNYADRLRLNGYDDWRIPTKEEAVAIYKLIDNELNLISLHGFYWTSSEYSEKFAWWTYKDEAGYDSKLEDYSFYCVR